MFRTQPISTYMITGPPTLIFSIEFLDFRITFSNKEIIKTKSQNQIILCNCPSRCYATHLNNAKYLFYDNFRDFAFTSYHSCIPFILSRLPNFIFLFIFHFFADAVHPGTCQLQIYGS